MWLLDSIVIAAASMLQCNMCNNFVLASMHVLSHVKLLGACSRVESYTTCTSVSMLLDAASWHGCLQQYALIMKFSVG
jgi:hypothetical protein